MSGPVDVLARIEACWGKDSLEYRAVAELIEAVRPAVSEEGLTQVELDQLRAALANVGSKS